MKTVSFNQIATAAKRTAMIAEEGTRSAMSKVKEMPTETMEFRRAFSDNIHRLGLSENEKMNAQSALALDYFA